MKKLLLIISTIFSLMSISLAKEMDEIALCPISRLIGIKSPLEFANEFNGDTVSFSIQNAEDVYFESFELMYPDTIWLRDRPKHNRPQEHKHFKLITHFDPVSGWGVNAYRQYTKGTSLELHKFILRGVHTEIIPYLGTFNYVVIEDIDTGRLIKWDYSKRENKGIIVFSSSIARHLFLMKGLEFIVEENDSTYLPGKCIDVCFSIGVDSDMWSISVDVDFDICGYRRSSHNWVPRFFLKSEDTIIKTNNN